ncbi:MAG: tetratricopeptide repeat protein [Gemmatimonadaceae bacterium]|nr:tetratricopeptide repeat protein [Chitinophagaceae bacterium]
MSILLVSVSFAQKKDAAVRKGNDLYKEKKYEGSLAEYNKALAADEKNPVASYNLGNALFRTEKMDEAINAYDNTIKNKSTVPVRQKSFYNKGVAMMKQQKLQESIDAWKESLKLDPNDTQSRENLQKALMELKKQQEQQQKNKEQEKNKEQDKQQKQPKEQQSKLSKQQVEQLLKALQQKEKEVQQRLQKGNPSPTKPEKDW